MARKPRGQKVDGWLVIDKPGGLTSTTVVNRVRRQLDAAKAGHAGTLDPIATGILPIAFGEATKTVPYLVDATKRYRFQVAWGEERSTDDREGTVTASSPVRPDEAAIRAALAPFHGWIEQTPPRYSAVKIDGQRAYDLARANEPVELAPRAVRIDAFELAAMPDPDHADFLVTCGKGAYMRALARDLARALGTCGHIAELRRLSVGPFDESRAISLDSFAALGQGPAAFAHLLPIETALDDIPALALTGPEAVRLRSGQAVPLFRRGDLERLGDLADGDLLRAHAAGKLVAVVRFEQGRLCPVRVLNL